jgi:hypothetical protein
MEENKTSIWDELKRIDLVGYLDSLGHQPKLIRNSDFWYYSPFREEKTPSFKVNRQRNVWFDHGSGEGGTIIDLGVKLFNCTYHELIEKLTNGNSILNKRPEAPPIKASTTKSKIEVLSIGSLKAPELTSYLKSRGIYIDTAAQYCSEVDFRIGERTYKAIGFPNRTGGFELRNQWFKGSSTPKDISLITSENNSSKLSVFEGFIDFLSALTISNPKFLETTKDSSFLVLNSVAFIGREIPLLRSFPEVSLFLDNDNAGKEAKTRLQAQGIPFKDASTWYSKHKDVNEFLLSDALAKKQESIKPKPRNRLRR